MVISYIEVRMSFSSSELEDRSTVVRCLTVRYILAEDAKTRLDLRELLLIYEEVTK